jgi:tyrosyl-tRNA synthetase
MNRSPENLISRGVAEVIEKSHLEKALRSGKKLRIKYGIDPTTPFLHLGHTVPLRKLRALQDAGHKAVLIIGDFTATVGDPSGKSSTRAALTRSQTDVNSAKYLEQAFRILDEERTEVRRNSEWFDSMNFRQFLDIASKVSAAQLFSHETFRERIKKEQPLGLHEFLYPVLQGFDSVMVKADVELGGVDQKFNLLMGRQLQKTYGLSPQDVLIAPYLIGVDGKEKMGKTTGNTINILDTPSELFAKIMRVPDNLILDYFELVTDVTDEALAVIKKEVKSDPKSAKSHLAKLIITEIYDKPSAEAAEEDFNLLFRDKALPKAIPEAYLRVGKWDPVELLVSAKAVSSKSEARRIVNQGGATIDNVRIAADTKGVEVRDGTILKVGKRRFLKIRTKV